MSYLPTYESDKYNAITEEEEIENEKDRIMKKFNFFSNNWNISSNSKKSLKSIDNSIKSSSIISLKDKYESNSQSPSSDISGDNYHKKKSIDYEIVSEDTEKDLKAIVEKALLNGNIKLINHSESNCIPNENEICYEKNIYALTSANIQQFKENSYRKKVEALFQVDNPYSNCEISNRDMFNNQKILTNYLNNKREFRFIEQVNQTNTAQPTANINHFLSLSDYSIYHLLSYCYDQYNLLLKHKIISAKLSISLSKIFEKCFESFRSQYDSFVSIQSHSFALKTIRLKKINCNIFDMILKVKVTKQIKENKCYTLSCSYYAKNEYYVQYWKIDLVKQRTSSVWLSSEGQHLNKGAKRFAYFQPILAFTQGDVIEIHLSIFNNYYCINPFSIKWLKILEEETPSSIYEKSISKNRYKEIIEERCCEIENMIHLWKTTINPIGHSFVEEVKKHYNKCFKIKELLAVKSGIIKKNFLVNFDIEIINSQSPINNEIQCMGLMNINFYAAKYQIRIGSEVILYATELYK